VIKALTANGFEIVGGKPEIFAKAMSAYISDVSEIGRKNNLEIESRHSRLAAPAIVAARAESQG
jgi:hypothetical protein